MINDLIVQQSADIVKADILHRGDIICWRQDFYHRSFVQRQIVSYQTGHEVMPHPANEISHVAIITGGTGHAQFWRGWEMDNSGGREVYFLTDKDYHDGQFLVLRFHGWRDDDERYRFCDYASNIAASPYSWTGIMHLATGVFPQLFGHFCSEQVELAARKAGARGGKGFVDGYKPNQCTPARIATSPYLFHVATVYHKKPL